MITYKVYTDIGGREVNEDSVGSLEENGKYCFVLADGLGGHGRGECASAIAVETALRMFAENYDNDFLDKCFTEAQESVTKQQKEHAELGDMKTTMVALVIDSGYVRWGHIGDSRLYHFNKNKIVSHTLDHSVPQMLVNTGEIKEKDIRGHEDRNRLLRVIGSPWNNNHSYDLSEKVSTQKCQAFLLCSDGFWELIDEKQMLACLKKAQSVEEWIDSMAELVKENGADSNIYISGDDLKNPQDVLMEKISKKMDYTKDDTLQYLMTHGVDICIRYNDSGYSYYVDYYFDF